MAYIKAVQADRPLTGKEWAGAIAYNVIFAAAGVAAPNFFLRSKNSPHAFTPEQMGPYNARGSSETTQAK